MQLSFMAVLVLLVLVLAMAGGSSGAQWCICNQLSDSVLQKSLDYACGAGADCTPIQSNGACFQPNTVKAHCSYAVNSYFQKKGQAQGSCDFSGSAIVTSTDPSPGGSCIFPSSSSGGAGTPPSTGGGGITPPTGSGGITPPTGSGGITPPTGTFTPPSTTTPPSGLTPPSTFLPTPPSGTGGGGFGGGGINSGGLAPSGGFDPNACFLPKAHMGLLSLALLFSGVAVLWA